MKRVHKVHKVSKVCKVTGVLRTECIGGRTAVVKVIDRKVWTFDLTDFMNFID